MSLPRAALIVVLLIQAVWAQTVVSAHSGKVNYVEGEVRLAGELLKLNGAMFPDVKLGQTLSTQMGHAEILLTPGVFLRLGRNASFRMISNQLTDTQVEVINGSALVEADEYFKNNRVIVKMGDSEAVLLRAGVYYFDGGARTIRAFDGKAQVSIRSTYTEITSGRELAVGSPVLAPGKFNKKKSRDELYTWSNRRSLLLLSARTPKRSNTGSFDLGACPGNVPGDPVTCEPAGLR